MAQCETTNAISISSNNELTKAVSDKIWPTCSVSRTFILLKDEKNFLFTIVSFNVYFMYLNFRDLLMYFSSMLRILAGSICGVSKIVIPVYGVSEGEAHCDWIY